MLTALEWNRSLISAVSALMWDRSFTSAVPHYSETLTPPDDYTAIRTEESQLQDSAHIDKAAVFSWQYTHGIGSTNSQDGMCGRATVSDPRPHATAV